MAGRQREGHWYQAAYQRITGGERVILIVLGASGLLSPFFVRNSNVQTALWVALIAYFLFVLYRHHMEVEGGTGTSEPTDYMQMFVAMLAPLELSMAMAGPLLKERVTTWEVGEPNLMRTLGYIYGFIDGAYQSTNPSRYDEDLVQYVFDKKIEEHLSYLPGVGQYLKLAESTRKHGGHSIAGMQESPDFLQGSLAGIGDLTRFLRREGPSLGLVKLLQPDQGR